MNRRRFEDDTVQQGTLDAFGRAGVREGEGIAFSALRFPGCGRAVFVVVYIGERWPGCNLYRRVTVVEWCMGDMADTLSICEQIYTGILPDADGTS